MGQERETGASGGHEITSQPRGEDLPITAPIQPEVLGAELPQDPGLPKDVANLPSLEPPATEPLAAIEPVLEIPLRRELPFEKPLVDVEQAGGREVRPSKPLKPEQVDALFHSTLALFSKPQREVEELPDGKLQHIKRIWREVRTGDRVHREMAISLLSAILLPIGPAIIGLLNLYNAGSEVMAVRKGEGSKWRVLGYFLAAVVEGGVLAWGQVVGSFVAGRIEGLLRVGLPGIISRIAGGFAGGASGMITGILTNTANWELIREGKKAVQRLDAIKIKRRMINEADAETQEEVREKMRREIITRGVDILALRENLVAYLNGNENGTDLRQLLLLYGEVQKAKKPRRAVLRRILRKPEKLRKKNPIMRKPLEMYYDHEIALEGIKRETAIELLGLLNDLFPQENAGIVEN